MPLVRKIFIIFALSKKTQGESPSLLYFYKKIFPLKMIPSLNVITGGGVSLHHFPIESIQQHSTRAPIPIRAPQYIHIYKDNARL